MKGTSNKQDPKARQECHQKGWPRQQATAEPETAAPLRPPAPPPPRPPRGARSQQPTDRRSLLPTGGAARPGLLHGCFRVFSAFQGDGSPSLWARPGPRSRVISAERGCNSCPSPQRAGEALLRVAQGQTPVQPPGRRGCVQDGGRAGSGCGRGLRPGRGVVCPVDSPLVQWGACPTQEPPCRPPDPAQRRGRGLQACPRGRGEPGPTAAAACKVELVFGGGRGAAGAGARSPGAQGPADPPENGVTAGVGERAEKDPATQRSRQTGAQPGHPQLPRAGQLLRSHGSPTGAQPGPGPLPEAGLRPDHGGPEVGPGPPGPGPGSGLRPPRRGRVRRGRGLWAGQRQRSVRSGCALEGGGREGPGPSRFLAPSARTPSLALCPPTVSARPPVRPSVRPSARPSEGLHRVCQRAALLVPSGNAPTFLPENSFPARSAASFRDTTDTFRPPASSLTPRASPCPEPRPRARPGGSLGPLAPSPRLGLPSGRPRRASARVPRVHGDAGPCDLSADAFHRVQATSSPLSSKDRRGFYTPARPPPLTRPGLQGPPGQASQRVLESAERPPAAPAGFPVPPPPLPSPAR
ncbi:basic proline-rich protein-like [Phyllostomus hastatus]|uniref:basic proline-rich protein-like n=1 Tax=Phyllostomus hastatus TaxID=9423 RepID=UPI001E680EFE|nr:basic proline-rich protein-like [Phyllostomus hastatus]